MKQKEAEGNKKSFKTYFKCQRYDPIRILFTKASLNLHRKFHKLILLWNVVSLVQHAIKKLVPKIYQDIEVKTTHNNS